MRMRVEVFHGSEQLPKRKLGKTGLLNKRFQERTLNVTPMKRDYEVSSFWIAQAGMTAALASVFKPRAQKSAYRFLCRYVRQSRRHIPTRRPECGP